MQNAVGDWSQWPAGSAYVSATLKEAGHKVICVNFIIEQKPVKEVLEDVIRRERPEVLACGDLISHFDRVSEIIETAKQICPDIITVIGGGMVTYSPIEVMKIIPSADYGIIGEGEITTCRLMSALKQNEDVSVIPGLVIRNGDNITLTASSADIPDIDNLPLPDYEGFHFEKLLDNGCASIVTARSCPFQCTYCTHSGGKIFRQRNLDNVFEEIDWLVSKYKIQRLNLSDELFSVKVERIIEFCEKIKPYKLKWRISLRISDNLTYDVLKLMYDAGCVMILFGLESADDTILKSMRKGITVAQIERCLVLTKQAKIEATGNFIFGDKVETIRTAQNTLDWVMAHKELLTHINLGVINLYPGSKLYDDAVAKGRIDPISHILSGCKPFNNSSMTDMEYDDFVTFTIPEYVMELLEVNDVLMFSPLVDSQYKIEYKCNKCCAVSGTTIPADYIYKSRQFELECSHCKAVIEVNLALEYAMYCKEVFLEMLSNNKTLIWGTGWFLRCLFKRIPELTALSEACTFDFCDVETGKQGIPIYGNNVKSPADALQSSYDVVLITNMFYKDVNIQLRDMGAKAKIVAAHELMLNSQSKVKEQ